MLRGMGHVVCLPVDCETEAATIFEKVGRLGKYRLGIGTWTVCVYKIYAYVDDNLIFSEHITRDKAWNTGSGNQNFCFFHTLLYVCSRCIFVNKVDYSIVPLLGKHQE